METSRDAFDQLLEAQLEQGTTAEMLQALAEEHEALSVEAVREQVTAQREALLERTATYRAAWSRAEERLQRATEELERHTSARLVRTLAVLGVLLALAATAVVAYIAVTRDRYGLLGLLFFAIYFFLPYGIAVMLRNQKARRLAVPERIQAAGQAAVRFFSTLDDQVTVALREAVNEALTSYSTTFRMFDSRGLKELADPEREVTTAARDQLEALMTSLSSGSIGLAGPRGSGKTTLIESFARGRSALFEGERIGLSVSAPVKYDAKEFVLHLYGALCERVMGKYRPEERLDPDPQGELRQRQVRFGLNLINGAIVLAVVGAAMLLFHRTIPEGPRETGIVLLVLAAVGGYVGLIIWVAQSPRISAWFRKLSGSPADEGPPPELVAQAHLEQIRYQQSVSSGWSGGLDLPGGLKLAREGSTTRSRTPWSLPEAVEAFRRYAATVAKNHYLVIGIDELDKMESGDQAKQFLNNVKGVFGVRGCYYLISVSDDAMSSFERRGLPFRDAFDSAFDAIQSVGYLTVEESRAVLESRVTGLPVPFQYLCHCLSGGLPRDLIRTTRELIHQQSTSGEESLAELARAVVRAEYRAKAAAAMEAIREHQGPDAEWVAEWLRELEPVDADFLDFHDHCLKFSECATFQEAGNDEDGPHRQVRQVGVEMAIFDYYSATVLELFGAEAQFAALIQPAPEGGLDPTPAAALHALAQARQDFSINPWLAWRSIDAVRQRIEWMDLWNDPRATPADSGDGDNNGSDGTRTRDLRRDRPAL